MITMTQTHSKKFHCTYMLHYYPFDTQVLSGFRIVFTINITTVDSGLLSGFAGSGFFQT